MSTYQREHQGYWSLAEASKTSVTVRYLSEDLRKMDPGDKVLGENLSSKIQVGEKLMEPSYEDKLLHGCG